MMNLKEKLTQELENIIMPIKAEMYRMQVANELMEACDAIIRIEEEGYHHQVIFDTFDFCIKYANDLMVDPTTQPGFDPKEYYLTTVFLHERVDKLLTNLVSKLVAA